MFRTAFGLSWKPAEAIVRVINDRGVWWRGQHRRRRYRCSHCGHAESRVEAGSEQRGRSFSGILWKILGVVVIALGAFFLLGMLGGILDGYGVAFILTCLVLGCGMVYLGIRLMRRGKAKS